MRQKGNRTRQKNKRGDRKVESNDSPEIPDRGETLDIPGLPSGQLGEHPPTAQSERFGYCIGGIHLQHNMKKRAKLEEHPPTVQSEKYNLSSIHTQHNLKDTGTT